MRKWRIQDGRHGLIVAHHDKPRLRLCRGQRCREILGIDDLVHPRLTGVEHLTNCVTRRHKKKAFVCLHRKLRLFGIELVFASDAPNKTEQLLRHTKTHQISVFQVCKERWCSNNNRRL